MCTNELAAARTTTMQKPDKGRKGAAVTLAQHTAEQPLQSSDGCMGACGESSAGKLPDTSTTSPAHELQHAEAIVLADSDSAPAPAQQGMATSGPASVRQKARLSMIRNSGWRVILCSH